MRSWAKVQPQFSSFNDQAPLSVSLPAELRLGQLRLEENQAYRWMRHGWDPDAQAGAGAWVPVVEEVETIEVAMHTPKNWTATDIETTGGGAHPVSLTGPFSGSSLIFDTKEHLTDGPLVSGLLHPGLATGSDLDDQSFLFGADWRVNGRFFGVASVPEPYARMVSTATLVVKGQNKDCDASPILRWAGQSWSASGCPTPWSHQTRIPAPRMVPYVLFPAAEFRVTAGALTVYADEETLRLRLEPPVGETVEVTADLSCVTATGSCL